MSEPLITALVLLDGASTAASASCTLDAVRAQSRRPDRVVAVLPRRADAELEAELRALHDIDRILRVPAGLSSSAAASAAVAALSSEDPAEALLDAGGAEASGRRARQIDREDRDRRLAAEAESLAQIPVRLREAGPRGGRRMGSAAGAEEWLWFVPDLSAPGAQCLASLLGTVASSPRTAVVGAKRLVVRSADASAHEAAIAAGGCGPTADDAVGLLDMGLTMTHGGRIATGVEPGEIDQGQADWREDVLAVSLSGMLVRAAALRDLGGLDPDLPAPWAEIDLCRRVWRSGERVAVQADARVLARRTSEPAHERLRDHRRGQILALLKQRRGPALLLFLVLLPILTAGRALIALLASQPRAARGEVAAWAGAMARASSVLRRGARARASARVPHSRLAPLYLPRGEDLRQRLEAAWTRLFADDERSRRIRLTTWGIAGTRHGIEDADYGRHLVWSVVLALSATVLGVLGLRGVLGRGDLVGPALVPLPRDWRDAAAAAWADWVPGGLGDRGPADPLLRLLGSLPLPGELFVEAIVFSVIPLSALAAWWAAGALTRAIGARLVLAAVWGLAPMLLAALAAGAWPLLLVHALLPLLALCLARAVGLRHKVEQASPSAAALGGLVLLVVGAVQPLLVVVVAAALAVIAPLVSGRRRRLLWVLVPSLALHAPYLGTYIAHPRLLLAAGSVGATGPAPETADLAALWPAGLAPRSELAALVGAPAAQILLMLPVLLVLPAALLSALLAGPAGRVGRTGLLIAAIAGGAAAWGLHARVAIEDGAARTAPVHALLGVMLLALAASAACTFDALARRDGGVGALRRRLSVLVAALAAGATAVLVLTWTLELPQTLRIDRQEGSAVPAAAADLGRSQARGRVLVLEDDPTARDAALARLLVQGEDSAAQRAAVVDLRAVEDPARIEQDPAGSALRTATAQLLSRGSQEAEPALRTLAVGYVVVPGPAQDSPALVDALDGSPLLEKVTQTATGSLWRVGRAAPRAEVRSADGATPLASRAIDARGTIRAAREERTIVLSERAESGWRASVDGRELERTVVDGWAQGFTVPAGAHGRVEIRRDQPWTRAEQLALAVAIALTAAMAIPWRSRIRSREVLYA